MFSFAAVGRGLVLQEIVPFGTEDFGEENEAGRLFPADDEETCGDSAGGEKKGADETFKHGQRVRSVEFFEDECGASELIYEPVFGQCAAGYAIGLFEVIDDGAAAMNVPPEVEKAVAAENEQYRGQQG